MAPTHVAAAFASPQEEPFLLLESTLKAVKRILRHASQQPLQRCWSNGRTLHHCVYRTALSPSPFDGEYTPLNWVVMPLLVSTRPTIRFTRSVSYSIWELSSQRIGRAMSSAGAGLLLASSSISISGCSKSGRNH